MIYNGRELSESEIQDMLHRETERDAKAGAVLIAYDTQMATPSEDSVYWTSGGGVFHAKVSCRHLSGKTVYYGTVEDAVTEGKLRACSVCAQK